MPTGQRMRDKQAEWERLNLDRGNYQARIDFVREWSKPTSEEQEESRMIRNNVNRQLKQAKIKHALNLLTILLCGIGIGIVLVGFFLG